MSRAVILLSVACFACGDDVAPGTDAPTDAASPTVRFAPHASYPVGSAPGLNEVVVHDLDVDGFVDIAVVDNQSWKLAVLRNKGDATFAPAVIHTTSDYPITLEVGDIDGDDKPDLVTNKGMHFNLGAADFSGETSYGPGSVAARIADLDTDGDLDIVIMHPGAASVKVLLGSGNGVFAEGGSYTTPIFTGGLVVTDVNSDQTPDLVVGVGGNTANPGHSVAVLLGTGSGTFTAYKETDLGLQSPTAFALGDLDGDGKVDLVATSYVASGFVVARGRGDGTFDTPSMHALTAERNSVIIADVNGDTKPDVVMAHSRQVKVGVFLNLGDGTLAPEVMFPTEQDPRFVAASDIDKDGISTSSS